MNGVGWWRRGEARLRARRSDADNLGAVGGTKPLAVVYPLVKEWSRHDDGPGTEDFHSHVASSIADWVPRSLVGGPRRDLVDPWSRGVVQEVDFVPFPPRQRLSSGIGSGLKITHRPDQLGGLRRVDRRHRQLTHSQQSARRRRYSPSRPPAHQGSVVARTASSIMTRSTSSPVNGPSHVCTISPGSAWKTRSVLKFQAIRCPGP